MLTFRRGHRRRHRALSNRLPVAAEHPGSKIGNRTIAGAPGINPTDGFSTANMRGCSPRLVERSTALGRKPALDRGAVGIMIVLGRGFRRNSCPPDRSRLRSAHHPIPWFAAAILKGAYHRYNSHQARLAAVPQVDPEQPFETNRISHSPARLA